MGRSWAVQVEKNADDRKRQTFLEEWHSTLQVLRDIGAKVALPENRPHWVNDSAPASTQADQFLHAHYYQRAFDGRKSNYAALFEENKNRPDEALAETLDWWRQLPEEDLLYDEKETLNDTAPFLRSLLAEDRLDTMTYEEFGEICTNVHAIRTVAQHVLNEAVGLPNKGTPYTMEEKIAALSKRLWNEGESDGGRVKELFRYVLYEGERENLPDRLWRAVNEPEWNMPYIGISVLGELVGWALPDFPPRNGRTSKALRSLGYDVTVHVA